MVRDYSFILHFNETTAIYLRCKPTTIKGICLEGCTLLLQIIPSCPSRFYPLRLFGSIVICVSDDYHQELKHSLPFAGFFSCISGNPLSLHSPYSLKSDFGNTHSIMSYMSLITRRPVFGICDQVSHKPACAAKEARQRLEISDIETRGIIQSR